jgi:hypothetical protein
MTQRVVAWAPTWHAAGWLLAVLQYSESAATVRLDVGVFGNISKEFSSQMLWWNLVAERQNSSFFEGR